MDSAEAHRQRYPFARPETLEHLRLRDEKLAQLRQEMKPKRATIRDLFQGVVDACLSFGRRA